MNPHPMVDAALNLARIYAASGQHDKANEMRALANKYIEGKNV